MESRAIAEAALEAVKSLWKTFANIDSIESARLSYDASALEQIGVELHPLDVDTGNVCDDMPQFMKPSRSSDIDLMLEWRRKQDGNRPNERDLVRFEGNGHQDFAFDEASDAGKVIERFLHLVARRPNVAGMPDVHYTDMIPWGKYKNNGVNGRHDPSGKWSMPSVLWPKQKRHVPIGSMLIQSASMTPEILRTELMTIATLLLSRIANGRLLYQQHWPVFVISIARMNARVLQAHYQHPHFVIRASEIIDLRYDSFVRTRQIVCWMMNEPCGEIGPPEEEEGTLRDVTNQPTKSPAKSPLKSSIKSPSKSPSKSLATEVRAVAEEDKENQA